MTLKFWEIVPPRESNNISKNEENPRGPWLHLRISLHAMALKVYDACSYSNKKHIVLLKIHLSSFNFSLTAITDFCVSRLSRYILIKSQINFQTMKTKFR